MSRNTGSGLGFLIISATLGLSIYPRKEELGLSRVQTVLYGALAGFFALTGPLAAFGVT